MRFHCCETSRKSNRVKEGKRKGGEKEGKMNSSHCSEVLPSLTKPGPKYMSQVPLRPRGTKAKGPLGAEQGGPISL